MRDIVVIAHDIRSAHNVGSLLRTADGLGVSQVFLSGYTPYPVQPDDSRLPHLSAKLTRQIQKTALNAQVPCQHIDSIHELIDKLRDDGYPVVGLEQTSSAVKLNEFKPPAKVALLLGREVEGIDQDLLAKCDVHLQIPMFGTKESFNVVQAAAMALYHMRFMTQNSQS